jgi:tetratricopeptide (TPR) repeat protein
LAALLIGAPGATAQAPPVDLEQSISPGQGDLEAALNTLANADSLAAVSEILESHLRAAITKDPLLVDAWSNLAILLVRTARSDEALQLLDQALQKNPQFADGYALQGVVREARGERSLASSLFEKALEIDAMNAIARNRKSAAAIAQRDWKGAIPHVRRALVDNPGSMNAYLNLSVAYFEMGLHELAKLVCNNGLQVDPTSAPLYNMLGLIRLKEDDVRGALREFNKAIEHDPNSADALINAGAIALNVNDFNNALERFDRALVITPDHVMTQISRGVALRGLGRVQEARDAYNAVIALHPDNEGAHYNLCILLQEHVEDFRAALNECRRLDRLLPADHSRKMEVSNRLEGIALMLETETSPDQPRNEGAPESPPEASDE